MGDPDYKNLQYNEDGSLQFEPGEDAAASSFNDQIKILGNVVSSDATGHNYENTKLIEPGHVGGAVVAPPHHKAPSPEGGDEDYMNDNPEGLDHTYSNHDDLLLQVGAVLFFFVSQRCGLVYCDLRVACHKFRVQI